MEMSCYFSFSSRYFISQSARSMWASRSAGVALSSRRREMLIARCGKVKIFCCQSLKASTSGNTMIFPVRHCPSLCICRNMIAWSGVEDTETLTMHLQDFFREIYHPNVQVTQMADSCVMIFTEGCYSIGSIRGSCSVKYARTESRITCKNMCCLTGTKQAERALWV